MGVPASSRTTGTSPPGCGPGVSGTALAHQAPPDLPLARRLARAALSVDLPALPPAAVARAKICLLDFLACAFEARDLPWSRQAVAVTRPADQGPSVIGVGIVATPADAAFANATLGHGLVREDMHAGSISHHGVVVWPTLLALAQRTPASGATLLAAAVVGYEGGARLGRALFTASLARLFRPTGIVGPIGGALAGARLLGLDEARAAAAVALAANTSAGLNQWPHRGGGEMYFHPAFAARNAVTAVELAEAGAEASEDVLEGEGGLFAAVRREPPNGPLDLFADGHAEILAVYLKPLPACNFAQTACQAALGIARELGSARRDVEAVVVRVPSAAAGYPGCDFAGPFQRTLQAKMSIQFGVASALARGVLDEDGYRHLEDPETARLLRATVLEVDPALSAAYPGRQGAEVEVRLRNGSRLSRRMHDVVPATDEEVRLRFRQAAARVVGEARAVEIERLVDALDSAPDAAQVPALCLPQGRDSL